MYRIKKDVNLEILKEYGFKKLETVEGIYEKIVGETQYFVGEGSNVLGIVNRKKYKVNIDTLYELIKDGLLEKAQ